MHLFYYTDSDSPYQFFLIASPNDFNSPLLVLANRLKKKTAVKYLLFFFFLVRILVRIYTIAEAIKCLFGISMLINGDLSCDS